MRKAKACGLSKEQYLKNKRENEREKKKDLQATMSTQNKDLEKFFSLLPAPLGLFDICTGGRLETINACQFVVPDEEKDEFVTGYAAYKDAKDELKTVDAELERLSLRR